LVGTLEASAVTTVAVLPPTALKSDRTRGERAAVVTCVDDLSWSRPPQPCVTYNLVESQTVASTLYQAGLMKKLSTADAMQEASLAMLRQRRPKGLSAHPF
jgi:hypothetical protein